MSRVGHVAGQALVYATVAGLLALYAACYPVVWLARRVGGGGGE